MLLYVCVCEHACLQAAEPHPRIQLLILTMRNWNPREVWELVEVPQAGSGSHSYDSGLLCSPSLHRRPGGIANSEVPLPLSVTFVSGDFYSASYHHMGRTPKFKGSQLTNYQTGWRSWHETKQSHLPHFHKCQALRWTSVPTKEKFEGQKPLLCP